MNDEFVTKEQMEQLEEAVEELVNQAKAVAAKAAELEATIEKLKG